MIDLADVAAEKLRDNGFTDAKTRKLDELKGGGIAVRRIPSTKTADYFTGQRQIAYLFQIVVVRADEQTAIDECDRIASLLPTLDLKSKNGSYLFTSCEVYTETQELEYPGFPYVYECRMRANITTTTGRI